MSAGPDGRQMGYSRQSAHDHGWAYLCGRVASTVDGWDLKPVAFLEAATHMRPPAALRPEADAARRVPGNWREWAPWVGAAWLTLTGCGAGDPDVVGGPVRLTLTPAMVTGHALPEALGIRRSALVDMDGAITCQVWLKGAAIERICGHLEVVEAGVAIDACDWRGADGDGVPDGRADEVRISKRGPGGAGYGQTASVENSTDAASYPSRVKAGDWVIQLAGRAHGSARQAH